MIQLLGIPKKKEPFDFLKPAPPSAARAAPQGSAAEARLGGAQIVRGWRWWRWGYGM